MHRTERRDGRTVGGVRVVELTGLTGAYATRMWAALGADVVVVEPPEGHVLRHLPPFAPGHDGPDASLWWAFFAPGQALGRRRAGQRRVRSGCWRRPTS